MMAYALPWGKRRCRWQPSPLRNGCGLRPRPAAGSAQVIYRRTGSIDAVFERFTDGARSVLILAQEEARLLKDSLWITRLGGIVERPASMLGP
jgi:hypothetical protein